MKYFVILLLRFKGSEPTKVIFDADSFEEVQRKIDLYDHDNILQYDIYKTVRQ